MRSLIYSIFGPYPVPCKILRAAQAYTLNPADRERPDTITTTCRLATTEIVSKRLDRTYWKRAGYTMKGRQSPAYPANTA